MIASMIRGIGRLMESATPNPEIHNNIRKALGVTADEWGQVWRERSLIRDGYLTLRAAGADHAPALNLALWARGRAWETGVRYREVIDAVMREIASGRILPDPGTPGH